MSQLFYYLSPFRLFYRSLKTRNMSLRAVYRMWLLECATPVDVNCYTHDNIHDYSRNYDTEKRKRNGEEVVMILYYRRCVFEIFPSEAQGMCSAVYFSPLYQLELSVS